MRSSWIVLIGLALAGLAPQTAGALPACVPGTPYIFRAGLSDELAAPADDTSRGAALSAAFPTAQWKDFDDGTANRFVGHTFTGLPDNIARAELELRARPHADLPFNDAVNLGLLPPDHFAVSFRFADLPEAHGTWDVGSNGPTTFTLALGVPYQALLAQMSSQHTLDVLVQDDTAVDFMELRVWTCPPPVVVSGLPNQVLGAAQLTVDGHGGLLVSSVGPGGGDGVKIEVGHASLVQVGLTGLDDAPAGSFLDLHAESAGSTLSGRLQREPEAWSFVPDTAALGVSVAQVRIYDADRQLVGTFPAGSGNVHFDSPPPAISIGGAGNGTYGPGPGPGGHGGGLSCNPVTETKSYYCGSCPSSTTPNTSCIQQCLAKGDGLSTFCQTNWTWNFCWDSPRLFWDGPRFYFGNCLYWDLDPFAWNPFGNLRMTANIGFGVSREQLGIGGFAARALGGAALDESASGLRLSNLGTGGGVALDTERAANAHVLFAAIDPLLFSPDGASLQADVTGSLGGTPGQPLGTLKGTHVVGADFDQLSVTADFSAVGAATRRAEVYDHGSLVTAVQGPSGPVLRTGVNTVIVWPFAVDALAGGGFGLTWPAEGRFTLSGGTTVTGDELRLVPETNAAIPLDYISGLALHTSGLPELTITDVRAASCLPVLDRQPANVTTAAGLPAVFSVAATSASPLTYRWRRNSVDLADGGRVAGSATATLTLSPTVLAQAGRYDVVVGNACGSVLSATATYTPGVALRSLLLSLIGNVQSLVDAHALSALQGISLSRSLLRALDFLRAGNIPAAANRVDVFLVRVNAFVRTGALSPGQGQTLTDAALALRARLAG